MMDDIQTSAAGFSDALMDMADYVDESIEQVIRKACIDLYTAIVERTPVDTGRAKGSWQLSTHHSNFVEPESTAISTSDIASIVNDNVSGFNMDVQDEQVVIYNNLEYIEHLENGTSQQAPAGMVSVSLMEFEQFFREALQGLDGVSGA